MGVHNYQFKNGVFFNSIIPSTTVLDALDIFISSSKLSMSEKGIVMAFRNHYIALRKGFPNDESPPTRMEMLGLLRAFDKLQTLFVDGANARGIYVPPTTIQTVNSDGTVGMTATVDDGGLTTTTEGRIFGVPTGAPDGFVKAQAKNVMMFTKPNSQGNGASENSIEEGIESDHLRPVMNDSKSRRFPGKKPETTI